MRIAVGFNEDGTMYTSVTGGYKKASSSSKHSATVPKGRRLKKAPDDYVVLDVETTGFSYTNDEIIEIAAIKYSQSVEVDRFSSLVKPVQPISELITDITGITNEMVAQAPVIADVLPSFLEFIGDAALLGQNITFDIGFIGTAKFALCKEWFLNDFLDTLNLSRECLPQLASHKLGIVAKALGVPYENAHRALSDCVITHEVYLKLKELPKAERCEKKKTVSQKKLNAKQVIENTEVSAVKDADFDGKKFVFTGTLARMTRQEAYEKVVQGGGTVGDNVTAKTDYLVNCDVIRTGKVKKALDLQEKGKPIKILTEDQFMQMLESPEAIGV